MDSQDKKREYAHNIWEIYRKEWETASPEKRAELNKRMLRWQELMKSGLTASQAYFRVMEEESAESLQPIPPEKKRKSGCFGCLGWIVVFAIIVVAINLFSSDTENSRYVYEDGGIHVGADGEPIELINNPNATNPTYTELIAFIREDTSDSKFYLERTRVCADFAEYVHNNAETKGIRAAWVSIDLKGEEIGHALNAFETTDIGLVYIDCTGAGFGELLRLNLEASSSYIPTPKSTSRDSIAYVEIGKEYGCIDIAYAKSTSYNFYNEYKQRWYECDRLVNEYNAEAAQYNQEIVGKVYYEGSPEAPRIEIWRARLEEKRRMIVQLSEELDNSFSKPLGIVEDIYIRW